MGCAPIKKAEAMKSAGGEKNEKKGKSIFIYKFFN